MQNRAFLGEVDLVAAKHRIDVRAQPRFLRQLQKKLEGFIRDAVLRIIQEDARALGRQPFATCRILGKKLSQMRVLDWFVVSLESLPRLSLRKSFNFG